MVMTGSKKPMAVSEITNQGLQVNLSRNKTKANRMRVLLNAATDTYVVKFYRQAVSNKKVTVTFTMVAEYEGVYFDQLEQIFTETTGLYTRFGA